MMANPHRGQASLKVGGKAYFLSLSINALCALEAHLDRPAGKVILELLEAQASPAGVRLGMVRALVWAALQDHHPEIDEAGAGDIIGSAGVPAVMTALLAATQLAFPAPSEGRGKPARPRKAGG